MIVGYMQHFVGLGLLGVRVVECPDLGEECVYFEDYSLLVVDAGLSDCRREAIACEALGMVAARLAA